MVTNVESMVLAVLVVLFGGCTWAFGKIFDRSREDLKALQDSVDADISDIRKRIDDLRDKVQQNTYAVTALQQQLHNWKN